jgi:hypothetical protein
METLLLLVITATTILGSYLLVNLTASLFSKENSSGNSMAYGNYHKKQQENQAYSNFRRRITKKTTQLRITRTH